MARSGLILTVALASVLLLGGCPSIWSRTDKGSEPGAQELYDQAERLFNEKDYLGAVESYERLKSAYPDFPKIPSVYVKIGDAFYANGSYDKAISRYHQFLELYPGHGYAPRVKYYIAMSYFNQIKTMDLDNAILQRASQAFNELAVDPRAGEWAQKAKEKYTEIRKKLAEKELYKARTYYKMGNHRAARISAQRVLDDYAGLGFDDDAKELVERSKDK